VRAEFVDDVRRQSRIAVASDAREGLGRGAFHWRSLGVLPVASQLLEAEGDDNVLVAPPGIVR
jgi:hypothetical protein